MDVIIFSIFIVAVGLLIYWFQAHEHAEWVKMRKGLAEIERDKLMEQLKLDRAIQEIRLNSVDKKEEMEKISAFLKKHNESMKKKYGG